MAKITRDAFLYMEPAGDGADFAQCVTCRDFDAEAERCAIHGPDFEVDADDSCGLYVPGDYLGGRLRKLVTPDESGFVQREVRCENCRFGGSTCALYEMLNKAMPSLFDLETAIKPRACCNAQQPRRRRPGKDDAAESKPATRDD